LSWAWKREKVSKYKIAAEYGVPSALVCVVLLPYIGQRLGMMLAGAIYLAAIAFGFNATV
jgi:hypothetical protein